MAASRNRNENASATLLGWAAGLIYFQWFGAHPAHLGLALLALVAVVGFYATDMLISNSVCTLAGAISHRITGQLEEAKAPFIAAAFVAPVLSFLTAGLALRLLA